MRPHTSSAKSTRVPDIRAISPKKLLTGGVPLGADSLFYQQQLLQMAEDVGHVGHWAVDLPDLTVSWSAQIYHIHGVEPASFRPDLENTIGLHHPDDRETVRWHVANAIRDAAAFSFSARIVRPNRETRYILVRGVPHIGPDNTVDQIFGVLADVTDQKKTEMAYNREQTRADDAEAALAHSNARFLLLAETMDDTLICLNSDFNQTFVSASCRKLFGHTPEEMVAIAPIAMCHPDDKATFDARRETLLRLEETTPFEIRMRHKSGHYVWVEAKASMDRVTGRFVVVYRDITARKAAELVRQGKSRQLERMATIDSLTGLANRGRFDTALDEEWRRALRESTTISLLLIDLDHFKLFNDRYGHQAGDHCLRAVSQIVAKTGRRGGDLAARYGGEELAVILPTTNLANATKLAEKTRAAIQALAIPHAGNHAGGGVATASIGVACMQPTTTTTPASLISEADSRLYLAKHVRNKVVSTSTPGPELFKIQDDAKVAVTTRRLPGAEIAQPLTEPLNTSLTAMLDRIAKLAATIMGTPVAVITLLVRNQQIFAGNFGLESTYSTQIEASFCAHVLQSQHPLIIPNATADPRFAQTPLVAGEPHIRFYAGAPLTNAASGERLGALCVIDSTPNRTLNPAYETLLTQLAELASAVLDHTPSNPPLDHNS